VRVLGARPRTTARRSRRSGAGRRGSVGRKTESAKSARPCRNGGGYPAASRPSCSSNRPTLPIRRRADVVGVQMRGHNWAERTPQATLAAQLVGRKKRPQPVPDTSHGFGTPARIPVSSMAVPRCSASRFRSAQLDLAYTNPLWPSMIAAGAKPNGTGVVRWAGAGRSRANKTGLYTRAAEQPPSQGAARACSPAVICSMVL